MIKELTFTSPRDGEFISEAVTSTGPAVIQTVGDGLVIIMASVDGVKFGFHKTRQVAGAHTTSVISVDSPAGTVYKVRVSNSDYGVDSIIYSDNSEES